LYCKLIFMEKNLPIHLQEVIFSTSDKKLSKQISKLEKQGMIRKIAPRIYSSNLKEEKETIIKRNLFLILGNLYPESMLSYRSAIEFNPTQTGDIFLTYKYSKKITIPGITIHFIKGHGPIEGDGIVNGKLYTSQRERALLENLQFSNKPGPQSKSLQISTIEEKLEQAIRVHGEAELNVIREKARIISENLHLQKGFKKLNKIISALLTTYTAKSLKSPIAVARALGEAYDSARLSLFQELFRVLRTSEFKLRPDRNKTEPSFRNFAFFESYFSNYIEGTKFEVEEAHQIIETSKPLPSRDEDSHDVLGTFRLVSNRKEMSLIPSTFDEFLEMLLYRHRVLLGARTDKNPGKFKDKNNRAGATEFVAFDLVRGTLKQGFQLYKALEHPFSRAAYMMFFLSEVHPFVDGNGRIARVFMNAELVKAGQSKIIIPNVYRDDYLGALRKLTRKSMPEAYIKMLQRAQEFSENIHDESWDDMFTYLKQCDAFKEHTDGKLRIISKDNRLKALDKKLAQLDAKIESIDSNKDVKDHLDEDMFFMVFDSWLSELLTRLIPVGQRFNKYFTSPKHHIFVVNGVGQVEFMDEKPELVIKKLRADCWSNRNRIRNEIKVQFSLGYSVFRKGGLKSTGLVYRLEIEFDEIGYKLFMEEFTDANQITRVLQEERLLHKPITKSEMNGYVEKMGEVLSAQMEAIITKVEDSRKGS
jgi:hypothetical protein